MDDNLIVTGVLMDENTTISFVEVCQQYQISEDLLLDMLEHGLISHVTPSIKKITFDLKMLSRIQSACRLQQDLGINLPGAVLALELRDELEQLREELRVLQHYVNDRD